MNGGETIRNAKTSKKRARTRKRRDNVIEATRGRKNGTQDSDKLGLRAERMGDMQDKMAGERSERAKGKRD